MVNVYWFVEGIHLPPKAIKVDFAGNGLVQWVRLAGCQLPVGAWVTSDSLDVRNWVGRGFPLLADLAELQLAMGLQHLTVDDSGVRVPYPQLDEVALDRGVLQVMCPSPGGGSHTPDFCETLRRELTPLVDLIGFAQRRSCVLTDAIVVDANTLYRIHETRTPALSPRSGYGVLLNEHSLERFLNHGLTRFLSMPREDLAGTRLAFRFHKSGCAQRALVNSRLLEHMSALDILTDKLVGRASQLCQLRNARDKLKQDGWPWELLPKTNSLELLVKVRNDLAHARKWKVLRVNSPEHNREKIMRATEICVTLLESSALHLLGFSPSGPRLVVSLPFRFKGWESWASLGQQEAKA